MAVSGLSGFVINVFLARYFSTDQFAIWALAFAILYTFSLFGDFGLGLTSAKFTAEYNATDRKKLPVLLSTCLINLFINTSVTYTLILIAAPLISHAYHEPQLSMLLVVGGVFVATKITFEVISEFFRGFQNFKLPAVTLSIFTVLEVGFYCTLFFGSIQVSLMMVVIARCGFWLFKSCSLIVLFFRYVSKEDIAIRFSFFDKKTFKTTITFSIPIIISVLSYYLYTKADILIIRAFCDNMEVARYSVAENIFLCPLMIAAAFTSVIAPKATAYFYAKDHKQLQNLYSLSITIIAIPMILFAVLFFSCSTWILSIFFPNYISSSIFLKILAPLIIIKGIGQVTVGGFLIATGKPKILARLTIIGGICNIIADLILIPPLGALGAFIATIVIHSAYILYAIVHVLRKLDLRFTFKMPDTLSLTLLTGSKKP